MAWTKWLSKPRSTLSTNRQSAMASPWISPRGFASNSSWHTKRRSGGNMRTLRAVLFVLVLCAVPAARAAADDQQQSADVLNQITDKIIAREAAEMASFRQYSPLVETYIQNMKND